MHEKKVHGVHVMHTNFSILKDLHSTTDMTENPNIPEWTPVDYEESPKWCTVSYWELTARVGEMFEATGDRFSIDGLTNPLATNRFSLGHLTNVNRSTEIERTRQSIGKGQYVFILCV